MNRNPALLSKKGKSSGDVFRTPWFVTRAAIKYCNLTTDKWCDPCPGEFDDISKVLKDEGIAHEEGRGDMFIQKYRELQIITNPPYSSIDQFLDEFFNKQKEVRRIILLLNNEYETVGKRREYFKKYLIKKITFTTRMNLTNWKGGEKADFGCCTYSWFEFDKTADQNGNYLGIYHDNSTNQYRKIKYE